jgi:hypothetical protein
MGQVVSSGPCVGSARTASDHEEALHAKRICQLFQVLQATSIYEIPYTGFSVVLFGHVCIMDFSASTLTLAASTVLPNWLLHIM